MEPNSHGFFGALRKGPPFHGSRSYREITLQNENCQMGAMGGSKEDSRAAGQNGGSQDNFLMAFYDMSLWE